MWFKKNKKEEVKTETSSKDDLMSKIIDEVLSEQAAAKEAAMKESAENTRDSAPKAADTAAQEAARRGILDLIEAFHKNQNNETYKAVLDALFPASVFVPMTPVPGSENKDEKTMKFTPAFVQNRDGEKLFSAFSDKSQITEEYRNKFSSVTMPFGAACSLAAKIPDCEKIIVNPFTKPFVINKELVENVAKAVEQQRENNKTMVEFSTPEPEIKAVANRVAAWLGEQPEIRSAYFSKMKKQGRISYVFIIDCDENQRKAVFERTVEHLKTEKVALPIALIPYKGLEKLVNESKHIEQVC